MRRVGRSEEDMVTTEWIQENKKLIKDPARMKWEFGDR